MLGDAVEAEDAAQETFWRAYQNLKRYDPQRSFPTWLLSIAAHYCIDQQRKRRIPLLSMDLLPEEDAPDSAPSPEKVVGELEETSQILAVSAVKRRLHRARKEMAQKWKETQVRNALPDRRKHESPAI
jgi:RNA polymerase sigma-70 factor (ECF subfamily)